MSQFPPPEWDEELAEARARIAELESQNQRLHDLVRYKRHELFSDDLISMDEYAELAQDHPAVARLESYDKAVVNVKARLQEVDGVARGLRTQLLIAKNTVEQNFVGCRLEQATYDLLERATALLGPEKSAERKG